MNILINSIKSQYNVLPEFIKELKRGFKQRGIKCIESRAITDKFIESLGGKADAIISFNGGCSDLVMHGFLKDYSEIPFFSYLVDHPLYHHTRIEAVRNNHHILCVDENHVDYVKAYYPYIKSCHMLAHGGIEGEKKLPFKKRSIPLFFSGSYTPSNRILDDIEERLREDEEGIYDLINFVIELMKNNYWTMEKALQVVFDDIGLDRKLIPIVCSVYEEVDLYIRSYYREKVVNTIAKNGNEIHLFGKGWDSLETSDLPNVHVFPAIDFNKNIELMGDSKIVLNVMPWFKRGSHERVLSSMLNGAVCVTDTSTWLEQEFKQFIDIAMFSLKEMDGMLQELELLLSDADWAEYIANNALEKARAKHTWRNRAEDFIDIITKAINK